MTDQIIRTDSEGFLEGFYTKDNETGVMISNETRVALIKFLGKQSRDSYTAAGLSEDEASKLSQFWLLIQT
jgi:hypothetical protein